MSVNSGVPYSPVPIAGRPFLNLNKEWRQFDTFPAGGIDSEYRHHHGSNIIPDVMFVTLIISPDPAIKPYALIWVHLKHPNNCVDFICDLESWELRLGSYNSKHQWKAARLAHVNERYSNAEIVGIVKDALSRWMANDQPI